MKVAAWTAIGMLVVVIIAWIDAATNVRPWLINASANIATNLGINKSKYDGRHRA